MPDLLPAVADTRAQMDAMLARKAWEDDAFRQRFVADPKAMIGEFIGHPLPDSLSVTVHEESPGNLHFVIPARPDTQALEELSDGELERIAGGTDPISLSIVVVTAGFTLAGIGFIATATAAGVLSGVVSAAIGTKLRPSNKW